VNPQISCNFPLDIIKSVPEFSGGSDEYVAWRQSAVDAYELFKPFDGSYTHYQAVTIIRNKVRGAARAVLVSHNTVLNFDAIIARLDCSYADKTSLRLLRQGLEMVRQGDLTLMEYYDEVERKLTLVTNKIIMTHESIQATLLNDEVRADALHAFITGLRKSLKAIVFPAQPKDLASALALAREAEASIERSMFSASYAKAIAEREHAKEDYKNRPHAKQGKHNRDERGGEKNPHFVKKQQNNSYQEKGKKDEQGQPPEPMEVDSSSKFRHRTNFSKPQNNAEQAQKRPNSSDRMTGPRRQKLHNVVQSAPNAEAPRYENAAEAAVIEIEEDAQSLGDDDSLNFLGNDPDCRISNDSWVGEL